MTTRSRCTSPEIIKKVNGWLTWFWLANFPPVIAAYFVLGRESFDRSMLLYLAIVSIWANVGTHFAGWVAGRVEVAQNDA